MMGMGEPLTNFDNVVTAVRIMLDDHAYGLSRRRVTMSTSGHRAQHRPVAAGVPGGAGRLAARAQRRVARPACADQPEVPVERAASGLRPLCGRGATRSTGSSELPAQHGQAKWQRQGAPRDFVTFEYVMLAGVNDQPSTRANCSALARDVPCKFNLIPFNPFPDSGFERSGPEAIRRFQEILMEAGLIATVRKTRGDDIDGACGQLAGQVQDRTRRSAAPVRGVRVMRSMLLALLLGLRCMRWRRRQPSRLQSPGQGASSSALERAKIHTELGVGYYESGKFGVALEELNDGDSGGQDLCSGVERPGAGVHGAKGRRPGRERLQAGPQGRSRRLDDQEQLRHVPVPA